LRKYLLNGTLLSTLFGGWGVLQTTRKGPKDWRLVLMWISWGLSVAIAVGTVIEQTRDAEELELEN
jgi:hypothetical protein